MVAILISAVALVLSIVALWSTTLNRRQQREVAIAQKRTQVLVAMQDIELALKPSIRDLKKWLTKPASPASQKLQAALDGMNWIVDRVRLRRNQLTEGISPGESSHKVLLSLETLMAELDQQVKKAHAHRATVEKLITTLNEARASKHEP